MDTSRVELAPASHRCGSLRVSEDTALVPRSLRASALPALHLRRISSWLKGGLQP